MYYYYTQNIFVYYLVSLYYVDVYCVALSLTLPHKSSSLRDPTAQTTDGDVHSADPPLFSPSGFIPHRVATAWSHGYVMVLQKLTANFTLLLRFIFSQSIYQPTNALNTVYEKH